MVGEGATPVRLLVVDDDPTIRRLLALLLRFEPEIELVAEAADGLEAIEAAGRYQPDVVLLDVSMPLLDGVDAIPGVRAAAPDCRIVAHSALEQRRDDALAAGAHDWVTKSGDIAELRRRLLGIVGRGSVVASLDPIACSEPS